MSHSTLKSLLGFKAWANAELFALLATLSDQHAEPLNACIRMLNHVYIVDCLFRARLSGEPAPYTATNTTTTPSLEQLRHDVAASDAWYEDYVSRLPDGQLSSTVDFTFIDGKSGRMSREEVLLHVVTHSGYHRGNVGQVLRSVGIDPPRDVYTRFLHDSEPSRRQA